VATPFLIDPGTVSAAVVIGSRHGAAVSGLVIFGTLALTMTLVVALKLARDHVKERNPRLIDRYMEVVGRISALLIGTIAVEMIMVGGGAWLKDLGLRP
jgi:small neutral amino acid transporter SnatA (MarC family)